MQLEPLLRAVQAWFKTQLPGGTAQIQAGLWCLVALALVYALWELLQRVRTRRTRGAELISLPGGEVLPGQRYALDKGEMVIGRALEADLRLAYRTVAHRHAAIIPEQSDYWLKDLGSRAGVKVNGLRPSGSVVLRDGDLLEVAEQPFRFRQDRSAPWRPHIWIWFMLTFASALFVLIQWVAWSSAGPLRPSASTVNEWSLGLVAGAWSATMLIRHRRAVLDPILLPAALALFGLGLAVILRTRPDLYARQATAGALGLTVLTLAAILPVRSLGKYRYLSLAAGITLLVLTLLLGREVGDQRLAISLGGFQFQPAEPAKLLLAVFLAGLLSERQELVARSGRSWTLTRSDVRYVGPMVLALAVALGLLVVQRDLGTALLFFGLFVAFLGMASGRLIFVLVSLGAFAFGAVVASSAFDRVRERVTIWLDPFKDPQGLGYQSSQALFALGSGGAEGVGVGKGFPHLIPAAHTDLPMAIIGEELGLVGTLAVVALLGVIIFRGYRAARRADDDFLGLLAAGLTTVVALQTLVIVGGLVRLLPLTGVTLPFVSFGGTSLIINLALIGMLLGVSGSAAHPLDGRPRRVSRSSRYSWRRQLRWVMATMLLGFLALGGALYHWQVPQAQALTLNAYNPRLTIIAPRINRGKVLSAQGKVITESVWKDDRYRRHTPSGGLLAAILGYASMRHGKTGVEGEADRVLQGTRYYKSVAGALERAEKGLPGDNVRLTIDLALQRKAAELLGSRKGSIVAIDPKTGAIRAIVSNPRFPLNRVDENWQRLVTDPRRPLVFPAAQGVYPPGSTFKMVTAAVALDEEIVTPETRFYCGGWGNVGGYGWHCFHGAVHGRTDLYGAFTHSCNVTFGHIGHKLGKERLVAGARKLGIGVAPPMKMPAAAGLLDPRDEKWASTPVQIGFGQGPLAVTPLQMALAACAIANDGVIMKPFVIRDYESPDGKMFYKTQPQPWRRAVRPEAARQVAGMMANVVRAGTGARARIEGLEVAGKTGTAENPHGKDHAWFVSFAPAKKPKLAVVVLVEGAGQGGKFAAPLAKEMYETYFGIRGK